MVSTKGRGCSQEQCANQQKMFIMYHIYTHRNGICHTLARVMLIGAILNYSCSHICITLVLTKKHIFAQSGFHLKNQSSVESYCKLVLDINRTIVRQEVVFAKLQPKITSFTVFVLMNNSSIIFSNTGGLSGGGTQYPGTLSGRTELMWPHVISSVQYAHADQLNQHQGTWSYSLWQD